MYFIVLKVKCVLRNGPVYVKNGEEMTMKYTTSISDVATLRCLKQVSSSELTVTGHRFDNASDTANNVVLRYFVIP